MESPPSVNLDKLKCFTLHLLFIFFMLYRYAYVFSRLKCQIIHESSSTYKKCTTKEYSTNNIYEKWANQYGKLGVTYNYFSYSSDTQQWQPQQINTQATQVGGVLIPIYEKFKRMKPPSSEGGTDLLIAEG